MFLIPFRPKTYHVVLRTLPSDTLLIEFLRRYSTPSSACCLVRRSSSRSFSITASFFTRYQYFLDVPLVRLTSSSKISVNSSANSRSYRIIFLSFVTFLKTLSLKTQFSSNNPKYPKIWSLISLSFSFLPKRGTSDGLTGMYFSFGAAFGLVLLLNMCPLRM